MRGSTSPSVLCVGTGRRFQYAGQSRIDIMLVLIRMVGILSLGDFIQSVNLNGRIFVPKFTSRW